MNNEERTVFLQASPQHGPLKIKIAAQELLIHFLISELPDWLDPSKTN
jgi:hypothetical protein